MPEFRYITTVVLAFLACSSNARAFEEPAALYTALLQAHPQSLAR
jgi:hypothetical protein